MPVPKTDALPLGYTPYGKFRTVERGESSRKGEAGQEERAVQGRGDISICLQSYAYPSWRTLL